MRRLSRNFISKWIIVVVLCCVSMPDTEVWAAHDSSVSRLADWEVRYGDSPFTPEGIPLWTQDHGSWNALPETAIPQFAHADYQGRYVWLKTKLPEEQLRDPALSVQVHEHFELYLGSERIYTFGEPEKGDASRFHGTPVRIVSLPQSAAGETLYLRIYASRSYTGLMKAMEWGDHSSFLLRELRKDGKKWIFGWMFIFVGAVGLYLHFRSKNRPFFRSFGIFTLAIGTYSICRTDSLIFFVNHPIIMLYMELLALFIAVIALLQWIEDMFGSGRFKIIRRLWQALLIADIGLLALAALQWIDTPLVLFVEQVLILSFMSIGWLHLFLAWRKRRKHAGIVMLGILIFCVTALLDMLDNMVLQHIQFPSFTYIGATVFVFLLLHALLKQFIDMSERVKEQEKLTLIGKLAAGVAHEVRNPITVISGNLQLMQRRPDFRPPIDVMLGEVQRVDQIMQEFLLMARPHKEETCQIIRLQEILADSLRLFEASWQEKGIQIEFVGDERTPSVRCDANQLRQVLLNLLKNAAEAMPEGGKVVVRLFQADNGHAGIDIADEGVGIAPDDWDKPGTPFYTTKEGGTGLGLMVSRKIVQDHGGTLVLKRGKKRGAIAEVRLPTVPEESARHS
ncbi:hypothetical protein DUZ99_12600 [Xylanibacillus composti]|uniref:ATP-binding protein n=1 Tax=Xylanibacillus composti TaxID=1572762 RepID=UPI0028F6A7E7|nr:ATP-binding protein [Xylanibacillus composti]MDT9725811.1 hypothetical protein [Xylanibacillus composti]